MDFEVIEKADFLQVRVGRPSKILPLVIFLTSSCGLILVMVYVLYYLLFIEYNVSILLFSIGTFLLVFILILDSLYWFLWGYELLEIKDGRVVTYVKGLYKINIEKFNVREVLDVHICAGNEVDLRTSNSEAAYFYGYDKGKICIRTSKKTLKFGSSLNDEEAKSLVTVIQRKLNELR